MSTIRDYVKHHFRHFNARTVKRAAEAWEAHLEQGGKMFLAMAGAMSTAEIGVSLAELIRKDKVHGLCVTGANLEEDIFNLVAHDSYETIDDFRALSAEDEVGLLEKGLNRVTDTCIPEERAMKTIEIRMLSLWQRAEQAGQRCSPHEYCYQLLRSGVLEERFEVPAQDSWLLAAAQKNLPIFVPGWEDSTLGNVFVARVLSGDLKGFSCVKSGLEQLADMVAWYQETSVDHSIGFFQIGGGIAGDYSVCVVPLIEQDLKQKVKKWGYFCQISDSTTSYGSYSGAPPNEKISWGKLAADTPRFVIESDATIVFPLVAAYLLHK